METNHTSQQWHEVKQTLKDRWSQLTDEDLRVFEGNMDLLLKTIQQKTGDARDTVASALQSAFEQGLQQLDRTVEATRECSADTSESVERACEQVTENVRAKFHEAEGLVRRRPWESIAVTFGAGIVTGLIVALLTRNRRD